MIKPIIAVAFLSIGLAACQVGPDYQRPDAGGFMSSWFGGADAPVIENEPIETQWWTLFNDPLLEKYIDLAVDNNKNLEMALANVRQARALRQAAGGALAPQIGTGAAARRSDSGAALGGTGAVAGSGQGVRNQFDAAFDASWELDIFGGNRRSIEAADARLGAAVEDYYAVMLSTQSEVARTYYEARGAQRRIAILQQNSALLKQTFDLIEARFNAGEASEFDRVRALGEYQLTMSRIPNLQAEYTAAVYRLSVLLGQSPETFLAEMQSIKPLPPPPDIVPVGLRSEILQRRPDVRYAERMLAASVADIGVETSELFPKFFLTGSAGSQARLFGDLFTAAAGAWSLGALLDWRLFEGGAIRARIEAREAESSAALSMYEQTVLEALRDAETALVRYGRELETRVQLEDGVKSRERSVNLARELLDSGESDFLAVLDAEREFTSAEDTLVMSETDTVLKLIALYTALGGGWEVYTNPLELLDNYQ